jgi:SnoaL-like domain
MERTGKGEGAVRASSGRDHGLIIDGQRREGGVMESPNVATYRAGHEAFNQRDFVTMTKQFADCITWTDRSQGRTFKTPWEFRDDFLAGWVGASPSIRITSPRYIDAGQTVVCTFTVVGMHDGPLGLFPATGKEFALPLCEMWHFDSSGRVVGGDLYYDQVSLLTQLDLMPQPSGA